jgi:hypothetical protein
MDPDPVCPKTCGSGGSGLGSATLEAGSMRYIRIKKKRRGIRQDVLVKIKNGKILIKKTLVLYLISAIVLDLQFPGSLGVLSPAEHGEERPVLKPGPETIQD